MSSDLLPTGRGFSLTPDDLGPAGLARLAAEAERAGYSVLFNAESVELDGVVTATAAVTATSSARVGTGVLNTFSRTPFGLAMAAATLAELSAGRFVLGLGPSTPAIVEGVHGGTYRHPLTRVAETVEVVRDLLRGGTVSRAGRAVSLPGARLLRPTAHPVPIVVAATGPRMLALAGRVADGVLLALQSPDTVRAAREVTGPDVTTVVRVLLVHPGDDPAALAHARRLLASYILVPSYADFLRGTGWARDVDLVHRAASDGGRRAAAGAVTDGLLADRVVVGPVDEQRSRLAAYRAAGADVDLLAVVTADAASLDDGGRGAAVRDALRVFSDA